MTLIQDPPSRTGHVPADAAGLDAGAGAGSGQGPRDPGGPGGTGLRPPVLRFVDSMGRAFDGLVEAPIWSMSDAELGEALVALTQEQSRLAELRGRVLAEAEQPIDIHWCP